MFTSAWDVIKHNYAVDFVIDKLSDYALFYCEFRNSK